jgi:hypothetical protein
MISVTQALSIISQDFGPDEARVERAAERGTETHNACTAYAVNLFPVLNEETEGYFYSFKNWWDVHVSKLIIAPETELRDDKLGFLGHCEFWWLVLSNGINALIDLKTPIQYRKMWAIQVGGGYWHLIKKETGLNIIKPGVLMLDPDGGAAKLKWVEEEEKMRADQLFSLFLQALNWYKYLGDGGGK